MLVRSPSRRFARRPLGLVLAAAALTASGCATSLLESAWPKPRIDLGAVAARHPHADAVVVRREDRFSLVRENTSTPCRMERAETIAIVNSAGTRYADVVVPVGNTVASLRARVTSPGGATEDVVATPIDRATARLDRDTFVGPRDRLFRLARVQAGSILEYRYQLEYGRCPARDEELVSRAIPVEHYHAELRHDADRPLQLRVYNRDVALHEETRGGVTSVSFDIDDVPARLDERFAPSPLVVQPWWAMTLAKTSGRPPSWGHALADSGRWLYPDDDHRFDGVTLKPEFGGLRAQPSLRGRARVGAGAGRDRADGVRGEQRRGVTAQRGAGQAPGGQLPEGAAAASGAGGGRRAGALRVRGVRDGSRPPARPAHRRATGAPHRLCRARRGSAGAAVRRSLVRVVCSRRVAGVERRPAGARAADAQGGRRVRRRVATDAGGDDGDDGTRDVRAEPRRDGHDRGPLRV